MEQLKKFQWNSLRAVSGRDEAPTTRPITAGLELTLHAVRPRDWLNICKCLMARQIAAQREGVNNTNVEHYFFSAREN